MVILVSLVAVGVWIGLDYLSAYFETLQERATAAPLEAAADITRLIRILAAVNAAVLTLFAALIIRHGWRGWSTASMPPSGSRILEGQRTWSGEPARRVARFTIIVGVLLAVLAVSSTALFWGMSDTITAPLQPPTSVHL